MSDSETSDSFDEKHEQNTESWKDLCIVLVLATIGMIAAIYSFAQANMAYDKLKAIANDYSDLINHWQTLPIQDIKLMDNQTCDTGYTQATYSWANDVPSRDAIWAGSKAWCDARPTGYSMTVVSYRCVCRPESNSATNDWGGTNQRCTQSKLSDSCSNAEKSSYQTFYTESGACNSTQLAAGLKTDPAINAIKLSSWKGKTLCFKRGGSAAMGRGYPKSDGTCGDGYVKCGSGTYKDNNAVCAPSIDLCPVTGLDSLSDAITNNRQLNLITGANNAAVTGLPITDIWKVMNVPCFDGDEGHKSRDNNPRIKKFQDDGCKTDDDRFEMWDTVNENELYVDNNVPEGGGQQMGTASEGFINAPTQIYDGYTYQWGYFFRREQSWDEECVLGLMDRVEGWENDVENITSLQLLLITLNGIFTLAVAIIYWGIVSYRVWDEDHDTCLPMKGKDEQKTLDYGNSCISVCAMIIRMIPLIMVLGATGAMRKWAQEAQDAKCSQARLTNQVINDTGTQIEKVYNANVQVVIFDILSFLMIILPICYNLCCKGDPEEEEEKQEGGDTINEENVEMYSPDPNQQQQPQPQMYPTVPMYSQAVPGDYNGDGIPDQYQTNLLPGWECRMQGDTPYWIDHNNQTSTWSDPRVGGQQLQYGQGYQ